MARAYHNHYKQNTLEATLCSTFEQMWTNLSIFKALEANRLIKIIKWIGETGFLCFYVSIPKICVPCALVGKHKSMET